MRDDCQTPSPAEIAAACLEIQSTWTPEEKLRRMSSDLRPTYVRCDGRREDIDAESYSEHIMQNEQYRRTRDEAHKAVNDD